MSASQLPLSYREVYVLELSGEGMTTRVCLPPSKELPCCAWEFQAQQAGILDKNVCGEGQGRGNSSSWTALAPHSPNLPSLLRILNPSALKINLELKRLP